MNYLVLEPLLKAPDVLIVARVLVVDVTMPDELAKVLDVLLVGDFVLLVNVIERNELVLELLLNKLVSMLDTLVVVELVVVDELASELV